LGFLERPRLADLGAHDERVSVAEKRSAEKPFAKAGGEETAS